MPHTNRKKKQPYGDAKTPTKPSFTFSKRQQIEDDDGWTHVVETPGSRKRAPSKTMAKGFESGDFSNNGYQYINRTPEELKTEFEHFLTQWMASPACRKLEEILQESNNTTGQLVGVTNVVCLGLGSLQNAFQEGRRASHTQLAALCTIIKDKQLSRCLIQDPNFTELDRQFLQALGFQTIEDPEAFSQVDQGSLVYAIHCYSKVYESILNATTRPAVLIGTDSKNFGQLGRDDISATLEQQFEDMVSDCKLMDFPQLRYNFSDTKIYWRKATDRAS